MTFSPIFQLPLIVCQTSAAWKRYSCVAEPRVTSTTKQTGCRARCDPENGGSSGIGWTFSLFWNGTRGRSNSAGEYSVNTQEQRLHSGQIRHTSAGFTTSMVGHNYESIFLCFLSSWFMDNYCLEKEHYRDERQVTYASKPVLLNSCLVYRTQCDVTLTS